MFHFSHLNTQKISREACLEMSSTKGRYEGDLSCLLHRPDQRLLPNIPAMCSVLVALLLTVLASQPCPNTGGYHCLQFCCHNLTLSQFSWAICVNYMGQLKCFSVINFSHCVIFTELVSGRKACAVRPTDPGTGCKELGMTWEL